MRYTVLFMLIIVSCSEPFQFDTPEQDIEVIDAKISTEPGNSYIDIYVQSDDVQLPSCNYNVRVLSASGAVIDFVCLGGVRYTPTDQAFVAVVGESYRFEATDENGRVFSSAFDVVPELIDFEVEVRDTTDTFLSTENTLVTRDVKSVLTKVSPQVSTFYAKFEFYYKYQDHFSGDSVDVIEENNYTLLTNADNGFTNILTLPVGIQERTDWRFWNFRSPVPCLDAIQCFDPCCGNPCCFYTENWPINVVVVQEVLSKESYTFWEDAQRLRSNNGLVFDTYPFPLTGNITCEGCERPFVGFFRTVAETSKKEPTIL